MSAAFRIVVSCDSCGRSALPHLIGFDECNVTCEKDTKAGARVPIRYGLPPEPGWSTGGGSTAHHCPSCTKERGRPL